IDVEGLEFPIFVTIPYDPQLLPNGVSENQVKFLHYNRTTEQWEDKTWTRNTTAHTVTGKLDALSPVIAGVQVPVSTGGGGGGTGGGGGSGGGGGGRTVILTWPPSATQPNSYFEDHPLERFNVTRSWFSTVGGVTISQVQAGQQITISGTFVNHQQQSQTYAFIVQVTDEYDVVTDLMWQIGTLGAGSFTDVSNSWTPKAPGTYKVTIFVWDGISLTASPLSEVSVMTIQAS
ncbi:MAG: hypothetical protein HRF40_06890, partial [Nitrososphaera sp.]